MPPGAAIGFITFIASTISSVSPGLDLVALADERRGAGLAGKIDRADHRRADQPDWHWRRSWRALAARRGVGAGRGRGRRWAEAAAAARCALDADAALAVLNLDFAQPGLVEQFGELADECGIDLHPARAGGLGHLNSFYRPQPTGAVCQSLAAASSASRYDRAPKPAMVPFAPMPT